jgi:hypothetical protein
MLRSVRGSLRSRHGSERSLRLTLRRCGFVAAVLVALWIPASVGLAASIWTTDGQCGGTAQDINRFSVGEWVYINGAGWGTDPLSWSIVGNPSSTDSDVTVASGTLTPAVDGSFCIGAYQIESGDAGIYQVKINGKQGDSYSVGDAANVSKAVALLIDVDGDGQADTGDTLRYTIDYSVPQMSGSAPQIVLVDDYDETRVTVVSSPIAGDSNFGNGIDSAGKITWTGSFKGKSGTLEYDALVQASVSGTISNEACMTVGGEPPICDTASIEVDESPSGSITVIKDAVPDSPQDFGFATTGGLSPANFSLDDDSDPTLSDTQVFSGLNSGTYGVVETVPSGWTITGIGVVTTGTPTVVIGRSGGNGGSNGFDAGDDRVTITLGAGDSVTVTFTNTQEGTITVIKDAVPDGPQDFGFATTGGLSPANFSLDDDSDPTLSDTQVFSGLNSGTYGVVETVPSGWTITGIGVVTTGTPTVVIGRSGGNGGSNGFDAGDDRVTITLGAGDSVTVTFTNTQEGTITVIKDAVPDGPQDFGFATTGGLSPANFSLDDDSDPTLSDTQVFSGLNSGTYGVVETVPSGWTITGIGVVTTGTPTVVIGRSGGNGGSNGFDAGDDRVTITLGAGDSVTVTFTNAEELGSITAHKFNDLNGNGAQDGSEGDLEGWEFTLYAGSSCGGEALRTGQTDGNGDVVFGDLAAGDYSVSETEQAGWEVTTPSGSPFPCRAITLAAGGEEVVSFGNRRTSNGGGGGGGGGGGAASFNSSPVPSAGPDQTVCLGERVCLDASASYDPDSSPGGLTFLWSFAPLYMMNGEPVYDIPSGSLAASTLEGADTATVCFRPDKLGDYVLMVTVSDAYGASLTDQVVVHVIECGEIFSCWYEEGWNLLSPPSQPIDPSASAILNGTSADAGPISYEDGHYTSADEMSPLEGYWVHFVSPDTISILGREIRDDVTLVLQEPGWHLISSPFAIDWDRVLVYVNGAERFVGEAIARQLMDDFCACYDAEAEVFRISPEILPCQGYWIRTYEPNVTLKLRWGSSSTATNGSCTGSVTSTVPLPPSESVGSDVASVLAYPNPVRHSIVHFKLLEPASADAIQVRVYDFSGKPVWQGEGAGTLLDWEPKARDGGDLAWGPYIYCIFARVGGTWVKADCGVLFVAELD